MDKLILIDGNSLLNRAYYAIRPMNTKSGFPTNAIFGFMKLIFKIMQDENPRYFAVAFDLHAPTFRHKMYSGYKATRKPMPDDLRQQVPVLKELLRAMDIRICEIEGYEADDVLGTLSRRFPDLSVSVYTGDRDAYQLVKENVSVCFTKRGVSDIDCLTQENFHEKTGLFPYQIIEEKSLMGDSSDNIPGVKGIGPKTAVDLLQKYDTLDGVYNNLENLSPRMKELLTGEKENAYLSKTLATIDVSVPIEVNKEELSLSLPFSQEARDRFLEYELVSLVQTKFFPEAEQKKSVDKITYSALETFFAAAAGAERFACAMTERAFHVFCNGAEHLFPIKASLLDAGFFMGELKPLFEYLFTGERLVLVDDLKSFYHLLNEMEVKISCPVQDVALYRYLSDSNRRAQNAKDIAKSYSLGEDECAYSLTLSFDEDSANVGETEKKLYSQLELPLEEVLFDMEKTGVRVDESQFPIFAEKYKREMDALSQKIFEIGGMEINLNSPFQLSELLFEKLKLDPHGAKKNARGGYSTSAEVLERLSEDHEIVRLILRFRELQKLQSTYIDGIRPLVKDGVVHTTYNQTTATTGRLSSSNPNLQNIPVRKEEGRELRKLFIPREGNVFVDADYSQIELRLLAHLSGCPRLIKAYRDGEDIHAITASEVFGVPLSEVTPLMRRRAKAVNFGIIYGISAFGLAKDIGISNNEAQSYINRYFETYSSVKEFMDSNVEQAKKNGYVTTILGRKRVIAELSSPNRNVRMFGERAAMNMPMQGSSADLIKIAMLNVYRRLQKEGMRSKIVLQVHDELILDSPKEEADKAAAILKEEMESAYPLQVPLVVDVSMGENWYDAK